MIELIQCPWSPYCLAQRRILEYSRAPFKVVNIPCGDPTLVWELTRGRYYQVPILKDGDNVLFETGSDSQVIAKYLDSSLGLHLFPKQWEGIQELIWPYIENDVEGIGFKLNDIYWKEFVEPEGAMRFLRHKERRYGRGCVDQWQANRNKLFAEFEAKLEPFEAMLASRPFLLDHHPRFVDFDLHGIVSNALYSGHYPFPKNSPRLKEWHGRLSKLRR